MKVDAPCNKCGHRVVCANKGVMEQVKESINGGFFNSNTNTLHAGDRYHLINEMSKCGIVCTLTCKYYISLDDDDELVF